MTTPWTGNKWKPCVCDDVSKGCTCGAMTTNDPVLAAADEVWHMKFQTEDAQHESERIAAIIRRHYAPLQQQLVGANVELSELRRANEVRTKSQKQLMAERDALQQECERLRDEVQRLGLAWHAAVALAGRAINKVGDKDERMVLTDYLGTHLAESGLTTMEPGA